MAIDSVAGAFASTTPTSAFASKPQPHQRDLLLAPADIQPKAERLRQQRLKLRHLQHHRLARGRSSVHEREGYPRRESPHMPRRDDRLRTG